MENEQLKQDIILVNTFLNADLEALETFCKLNKQFRSICNDDSLWKEKLLQDYGEVDFIHECRAKHCWRNRYIALSKLNADDIAYLKVMPEWERRLAINGPGRFPTNWMAYSTDWYKVNRGRTAQPRLGMAETRKNREGDYKRWNRLKNL